MRVRLNLNNMSNSQHILFRRDKIKNKYPIKNHTIRQILF